jgi:hypothetical protein
MLDTGYSILDVGYWIYRASSIDIVKEICPIWGTFVEQKSALSFVNLYAKIK